MGLQRPHHRIRLSKEAKADIKVWMRFLAGFNGRAFFLDNLWVTSTTLELFTDTVGSKAMVQFLVENGFTVHGLSRGAP